MRAKRPEFRDAAETRCSSRLGLVGALLLSACSSLLGLDGDYYEASGGRGGAGGSAGAAGSLGEGGANAGTGGSDASGGSAATAGEGGAGAGGEPATAGTGMGGAGTGGRGGASPGGAGEAGDAGDGGENPRGGSSGAGASGAGAGGTGGVIGADGPPSCVALPETCGPEGNRSCCRSAVVPGGAFNRSNDERFPATISPFYLDVYEATVGRFRQFLAAYDGTPPAPGSGRNPNVTADTGWNSAWDVYLPSDANVLRASFDCMDDLSTWTDEPGENETRPMNCVNWYLANAFCIWDGGRLPTEAEWNFAAAGGREQRFYPWSLGPEDALIDQTYASYYYDGTHECFGDGTDGCAMTDFIRVGSKPRGNGRWGHADLAGNVYEWVLDGSDGSVLYASEGECDDCAELAADDWRIARGGCFFSARHIVTTLSRVGFDPAPPSTAYGVRCVH